MTKDKKAELLDWIAKQDRLRIETWHYMGGRQATSVWTIMDDEDTPSGKAPTVIDALVMAKQAQEHDETRWRLTPKVSRGAQTMTETTNLQALGSTAELGEKLCQCRQCLRDREESVSFGNFSVPAELTRMILCAKCGNKRCPHATDHRHECTGSNEPGQNGSAYENCVPPNA